MEEYIYRVETQDELIELLKITTCSGYILDGVERNEFEITSLEGTKIVTEFIIFMRK